MDSSSAPPSPPRRRGSVLAGRRGLVIAIVFGVMVLADAVALAVHLTTGGSHPSAADPSSTVRADPPRVSKDNHAATPSPRRSRAVTGTPGTDSDPSGCHDPRFVSSSPTAGWSDGPYYVSNDGWNVNGYDVTQTMYACSYSNWYVIADIDIARGYVKSYPNSHRNFDAIPVGEFHAITSTFAETSPHVGIYEDAYDIWLNGAATAGSTEIMVWNDTYGQTPKGAVVGTATLGGRTYTVWQSGKYVAFVAEKTFTSGTVDLLEIFNYVIAHGWMPPTSTLSQVDYGAELVTTGGSSATFTFTNFSVSSS